eukprot:9490321-Pyramimonas_sp.AAC.1
MTKGKTCSKYDMFVAEMLQAVSDDALSFFADMFVLQILNHRTKDVEPCGTAIMSFVWLDSTEP